MEVGVEGRGAYDTVSRLFPNLFANYRVFKRCVDILGALDSADQHSLRYLYKKGLLYRINTTTDSRDKGKNREGKYRLMPTPRCIIIMILSIPSFRDNRIIMNTLADGAYKGNRLALALILIGLVDARDGSIYNTLVDYASNHTIDDIDDGNVADSLLEFLSNKVERDAIGVQGYIDVFKDFTSSTLDNVLRVIIASIKPRVEDYNGFIQLMHEVVRFYYDPVRIAYMHVAGEREEFRIRLEQFKKEHDISMIASSKGGRDDKVEVSFKLDNLHGKVASLPYYLQIIAFKLMIEPREFMLKELERYVWG
ncbi:MAG: hypothetical protein QXL44_02880 [Candidatus Nitrosocaldus sp.]